MSKIENDITHVADEIIQLICDRLGINLKEEMKKIEDLEERIKQFQVSLIWKDTRKMHIFSGELSKHKEFLKHTHLYTQYLICLSRYEMFHGDMRQAFSKLKKLYQNNSKFPQYEKDLIAHHFGIYYLLNANSEKALYYLKLTSDSYRESSPEFYYHYSLAYSNLELKTLASYYSEKALKAFKEQHNMEKILETEMLRINQLSGDTADERNFIINQYLELLRLTELFRSTHPLIPKILHNLGYEYLEKGHFDIAIRYFEKSMNLKSTEDPYYLSSYFSYINCLIQKRTISVDIILKNIEDGYQLANKQQDEKFKLLFTYQKLQLLKKEKEILNHLTKELLPFFHKTENHTLYKIYGKVAFDLCFNQKLMSQAAEIAKRMLD
ncbi:hypothetical protein HF072_04920 [Bacillus sp. RO3]|nr:hypothetical protein [Bacillus sp. RO3]